MALTSTRTGTIEPFHLVTLAIAVTLTIVACILRCAQSNADRADARTSGQLCAAIRAAYMLGREAEAGGHVADEAPPQHLGQDHTTARARRTVLAAGAAALIALGSLYVLERRAESSPAPPVAGPDSGTVWLAADAAGGIAGGLHGSVKHPSRTHPATRPPPTVRSPAPERAAVRIEIRNDHRAETRLDPPEVVADLVPPKIGVTHGETKTPLRRDP